MPGARRTVPAPMAELAIAGAEVSRSLASAAAGCQVAADVVMSSAADVGPGAATEGVVAGVAGLGAGSGSGAGAGAARTGLASSLEVSAPPPEAGKGACPPRLGGGELIPRMRK